MKEKFEKAKPVIKKVYTILTPFIFIGVLLLLVIAFIPAIPGLKYKSYTVLSGSMEPTIKVGALLITKEVEFNDIEVDDIITYEHPSFPEADVTHRVIRMEETEEVRKTQDGEELYTIKTLITKGDANDNEDNNNVYEKDVQGIYVASFPLLGRVAAFVQSPPGFILLVILPALLIILSESWKIKIIVQEHFNEKLKKEIEAQEKSKQKK